MLGTAASCASTTPRPVSICAIMSSPKPSGSLPKPDSGWRKSGRSPPSMRTADCESRSGGSEDADLVGGSVGTNRLVRLGSRIRRNGGWLWRGAGSKVGVLTLRAGIFGYPISHSISPAMHQAAFDHAGVDATYEAWETPPGALAEGVRGLRGEDFLGANVTVPHKQAVIEHLDIVDDLAGKIGAVNTIVNDSDRLLGSNTDGARFHRLAEGAGRTGACRTGRGAVGSRRRGRGPRRTRWQRSASDR